jgi:GTP-binding protein
MKRKLPIVAIVGRANVGKSSLYNAVLSRREAIVAKEAGTTRDAIATKANWKGSDFWLVDTAGMKEAEDEFELSIQDQIKQAVEDADVIWLVVEADVPITDADRRLSKQLLKSGKPIYLVINKVDKARKKDDLDKFERLGIKHVFPTCTTQYRGISQLLDDLVKLVPQKTEKEPENLLKVALLGRPNVGKSYLFNTMAKKQQAIVADKAGTTRDINKVRVRYKGRDVELIDTAGIRRSGKIGKGIEHFSVLRSLRAIEQADICLMLMTVDELNVQLDQKIAGMIKDSGKGLILVVSKWDTLEDKTSEDSDRLSREISHNYDFIPWAPLIFTSAATGQNTAKIFDLAMEIDKRREIKIETPQLNKWLKTVTDKHPPAGLRNRSPKLNYMVQETETVCPSFKIFGSNTKFVHWSYRRYLERELREVYDLSGTPVQLWLIEKHEHHRHGARRPKKED